MKGQKQKINFSCLPFFTYGFMTVYPIYFSKPTMEPLFYIIVQVTVSAVTWTSQRLVRDTHQCAITHIGDVLSRTQTRIWSKTGLNVPGHTLNSEDYGPERPGVFPTIGHPDIWF